jgi:transglutaminase-like putative cysteine protease
MATKIKTKNIVLILLAVGILIFLVTQGGDMERTQVIREWQDDYMNRAAEALPEYSNYVADTSYYDYNNPTISQAADAIALTSSSPEEAIERTLEYVYANVRYVFEPASSCLQGTAPEILAKGTGQCDTQSMVVISMLRRMGIATVPVGGCIIIGNDLQSVYLQSLQAAGDAPQFEVIDFYDPNAGYYSRGPDPDAPVNDPTNRGTTSPRLFSRLGGLHAWVVAWTPEQGWLTLEPTTGKLADTEAFTYHVEVFPSNNDKTSICISQSTDYMDGCSRDDLTLLNNNGVGVAGEVEP